MLRNALALGLLIMTYSISEAQNSSKNPRPDIPGSFIFDLGFNYPSGEPAEFNKAFFGSRTINVYYQYPLRFGRSNFSFNPGIGFSFERFRFSNEFTLIDSANNPGKFHLVNANGIYNNVVKSLLVTNYLEIPLEFRYDTKPEDVGRSFNVAIGGRIGYMIDSFTKIKYREDGETKKIKDKQQLGLRSIRYGVYTRVGVGAFNLFTFVNLSPLFQDNKGPSDTEMTTFTVGLSLNAF